MTHNAPTILTKKLSFLTCQTRLLTTPDPLPSRAWTRANASSEAPIPQRAVDEALLKLAHATKQHSRRVYPPQATRHVAEQIERLYWEEGGRGFEGVGGGGIRKEVDITDDAVISRLPPTWPSSAESTAHPPESHRYTIQSARLAFLSDERRWRRERVLRLRRMRETLRPFDESLGEDASGVQENLLTRGGALERELERMRVLLARVAGRVEGIDVEVGGVDEDGDVEDVIDGDQARVDRVLESL